MYEIVVCPLKMLYLLSKDGDKNNVAVIAVSSYGIRLEELKGFCASMCMNFADITDAKREAAFATADAEQIAAFVKKLPDRLDTLFVCCDSGESRSPALAAAIARYNGLDDMSFWTNPRYHPNPLVYKRLCTAFGIELGEGEADNRLSINRKAFSDAVRQSNSN